MTIATGVNPQSDRSVPERDGAPAVGLAWRHAFMAGGKMEGRNGGLVESGAYWLLYVVSVSGALLHWRLGNEGMAAVCAAAAVFGAILIGRRRRNVAAHR